MQLLSHHNESIVNRKLILPLGVFFPRKSEQALKEKDVTTKDSVIVFFFS